MSHRTEPSETASLPKGIPYIIANEAAERFSFYGMKAALAIFIAHYLHLMGDKPVDPVSDLTASNWVHDFGFWVYMTPLIGAIISDLFWGKYKTIIRLSIVYCLGHLALAFMGITGAAEVWMLAGLGLIAIGGGGIKPCVSAHVGDQFGKNNQHLLTKVFNWFYFSINLGSALSTIAIPWMLEWYGPHFAFGLPGALMILATLFFWSGRNKFVHIPASGGSFINEIRSAKGIATILKLSSIFAFVVIFWALFEQTATTWIFQSEDMDRVIFGYEILPSQIQSVNPFLILILIPLFTYIIYPAVNKVINLTSLRKIGTGLFITAISFALSALIQGWIDAGDTPHISWQLLAFLLLTTGEIMVSIVCLEFAYTQAPKSMKSWIMAIFFSSVALGNLVTSSVNRFILIPSPHANETALYIEKQKSDPKTQYIEIEGFDQNSNIVTFFNENGTVKDRQVPSKFDLHLASKEITDWTHKNDRLPSSEEGQKLISNHEDQWKNDFQYRLINSNTARIRSFGPDKKSFTKWDTLLTLEYSKGEKKEDPNTWLARRKKELNIQEKETIKDPNNAENFSYTYSCGGLYKLEGASYFWFFTGLMFVASLIFIPVAMFYTRSYLKNQPPVEPTKENLAEAEATLTQH